MGRLVRRDGRQHRETQQLLPWRLSGTLDVVEQARVDAHLAVCAECRADLAFQKRLKAQAPRPAADVEQGWSKMLHMLEEPTEAQFEPRKARPPPTGFGGLLAPAWRGPALWGGGGALAGVAAATAVVIALAAQSLNPPAAYHALGARPVAAPGNVAVIFRPETSERALSEALQSVHARVVDGPTQADAYVLSIPAERRAAALAALQARPEVILAQPIDPSGGR